MKKDLKSLKEKLEQINYPSLYMFKFIVATDLQKVAQIEAMFNSERAEISRKESSKGTYVSLSIKEVMVNSDEILDIYMKASKIEGVIAL